MEREVVFVGRKKELAALRQQNWRDRTLLVAVYGRRRVGKTALVEHAYKDDIFWKFEGIEQGSTKTQLQLFLKQLSRCSGAEESEKARDWDEAFSLLNEQLAALVKKKPGRIVVFFDEFQWLCEMKPGLVSTFKYYWDNFFSKYPGCVFLLCGSVSSFIVKKVIQSRALYGRVDLEINLQPLSISECRSFLADGIYQDQYLDIQMILGGVPQYLLELNPRMSLTQNLNQYAFKSHGFFFREFDRLFISHFASHNIYERILRALARKKSTLQQLAGECNTTSGGTFSNQMKELELAGFISRSASLHKKRAGRLIRFSINDEFLHFYFSFIQPHSAEIISGNLTFQHLTQHRSFEQWRGYAFERLCRKHSHMIAEHLQFAGIRYKAGSWFTRGSDKDPGAQIDLMFDRADKVLTICEVKFVKRLQADRLGPQFERRLALAAKAYPSHAIEKVLILGQDIEVPDQVRACFDHLLTAEAVFGEG